MRNILLCIALIGLIHMQANAQETSNNNKKKHHHCWRKKNHCGTAMKRHKRQKHQQPMKEDAAEHTSMEIQETPVKMVNYHDGKVAPQSPNDHDYRGTAPETPNGIKYNN